MGPATAAVVVAIASMTAPARPPRRIAPTYKVCADYGTHNEVVTTVDAHAPAADATTGLQRLTLAGMVVIITVLAVEAMAVATIMPTVVKSLHGLSLYGWSFTAYLLADVVGMVDAGARVDRVGPRTSIVLGMALFGAGLVVDATAQDMAMFTTGRALQGLGGGSIIVAVYVLVARTFSDERRPRVFAAMAGAWVVPALVGPAIAGAVASTIGWRWVFAGIVPLTAAGGAMLVPVLRQAGGGDATTTARLPVIGGVRLAVGLGLLQLAGQQSDWWSLPLVFAGVWALTMPLRRLLPPGALRARAGLPTAVLLRGLLSGGFFGAEAYLPLTLTRIHHGSPAEVGIPLTVAAMGWSIGSWWQGRVAGSWPPQRLLRLGFSVTAIGVGGLVAVSTASVTMWAAAPIWGFAGAGMGLAMPTISLLVLRLSPLAEQGANSAALQVSDVVGSTIGVTAAATLVLVAGTAHLGEAMRIADPLLACAAVAGLLLSRRAVNGPGPGS